MFGVSREAARARAPHPPRQGTLFLADYSSRPRARLSCLPCLRFSSSRSFFPSCPLFPPPLCDSFIQRSRPWRADRRCPCLRSAFAIRPLSPSRFLPRMFLLSLGARARARYSLDREWKSLELNECRAPLEGSLSMPRREKRQCAAS